MRTIKELLEIMNENIHLLCTGLCGVSCDLLHDNLYTYDEYVIILEYIKRNRPNIFSSISAFKNKNSRFYWKAGEKKPRIKWIKKHIKLNSQ